jgi:hypothetical protein
MPSPYILLLPRYLGFRNLRQSLPSQLILTSMCLLDTQICQSQYYKQHHDGQEHENRVRLALFAPGIEVMTFSTS